MPPLTRRTTQTRSMRKAFCMLTRRFFMNKKVRIVFLVSIIVNVLLLGIVVGALPQRFERRVPFQDRLKTDAEKLQEPARTRFLEGMETARKEAEPMREQMRQAREETL